MTSDSPSADLDGRFGQGWGGAAPNGVHVNTLIGRRGSPTAAAIATAFTSPSDGFTPVLSSVGATQAEYQTVYPPTVILSKVRADRDPLETMVFGAAAVGVAQAVNDLVAEGLLTADQSTSILVSLWIDPAAADETTVKGSTRQAVVASLRESILGKPADAPDLVAGRDAITHPFYGGR